MIDAEIATAVAAYLDRYPAETARLARLTAALAGPGDLTSRATLPGHVTCSAYVVDPDRRVLYIRHNALGRWLRPGGHVEAGDATLAGAALREVVEETGIAAGLLTLAGEMPVDIDVHAIPANPAKGEPAHDHYDLRYVFTVAAVPEVRLQADEVGGHTWRDLDATEPAEAVARVAGLLSPGPRPAAAAIDKA